MTVTSDVSRSGPYTGTGLVSVFPYEFKIFAETDLRVIRTDSSGVETTLALTTDYTVSGVLDDNGGNVTLVAGPLAVGYTLSIRRVLDATQPADLKSQGRISAEVAERAYDRAVMLIQQLQDEVARSLRLPEGEAGSELLTVLPSLSVRKGKQPIFDPVTGQITVGSPSSAAVSAAMQAVVASATLSLARAAMGVNQSTTIYVTDSPYNADPTGVADATAAINSALVAGAGKHVHIPAGTYKITGSISIPTGTLLSGDGNNSILLATYNGPIVKGSTAGTTRMYKIAIRDLVIDGTNKATYPLSAGVRLLDVSQGYVENVLVRNCGDGFEVYATGGLGAYYNTFVHCDAATCNIGYYCSLGGNETRFFGCRSVDTVDGFQLTDVSGAHLVGCSIETFTTRGVRLTGTSYDVRLLGVRIENAPTVGTGIDIGASCARTMIVAPYFLGLTTNINNLSSETFQIGYDGLMIKSGTPILKHLSTTVTVDVGSIPAGTCLDTLIAFSGIVATDSLTITPDLNIPAGLMCMAIPYSGGNNFYLRMANVSAGAINPPSLTHRVDAWRH